MNIAFIVGQFPLLSESFILNQISGLMDRGHDVHIYATQGRSELTSKVHPIFEKYQLETKTFYSPTIPASYIRRLVVAIRYLWQQHCLFTWRTLQLVNPFRFGRQALSLRLLFRAMKLVEKPQAYDVIHAQFGDLGLLGLTLQKSGLISGKLVTHFRGHDVTVELREQGKDIYDHLFLAGDFFLVNCDFFKQILLTLGCPQAKIQTHGSAIDCQKFEFKPRYFPDDGVVHLATIGRLVEKKGIEYCIKALALAKEQFPNIRFDIIGEGELRPQLEELIHTLQANAYIKLLGWKSQQEIIDILNDCHIFLAPSITAQDGDQDAPVNTLKEAMAMGLPVISTWHGGIPELVEDGKSGYLVEERDADAIADKIMCLIEQSDRWKSMGEMGRARVIELYDIERLSDELEALYENLVNH